MRKDGYIFIRKKVVTAIVLVLGVGSVSGGVATCHYIEEVNLRDEKISLQEETISISKKEKEKLEKSESNLELEIEKLNAEMAEKEQAEKDQSKIIDEMTTEIKGVKEENESLKKQISAKKESEKVSTKVAAPEKEVETSSQNVPDSSKESPSSSEWKPMSVNASAYTMVENGDAMGGTGLTSTGTVPTAGHTIAVDPSVIPYGSLIQFNGVTYTAEDTGGVIDGYKVDIFMNTLAECESFGRQNIEILVKFP